MITKIKVNKQNKCVPKDFEIELNNMTIITGENNVGKTTFVKSIFNRKEILFYENEQEIDKNNIEIVFFPAENISPSDSELKSTSQSSNLLNNLTLLFERLDVEFKLENCDDINFQIENVFQKIQENMESFFNHRNFEINVALQQFLNKKVIIQSLIEKIVFKELGEDRKLNEIGQGIQRLIIISVLKSYSDILKEKEILEDKKILILFEEPEIFLHPKLKRILNTTLETLSKTENLQILLTTHDPYFTFRNVSRNDKILYSFSKNDSETICSNNGVISGVEDELLFIQLYNKIKEKDKFQELKRIQFINPNREYFGHNTRDKDNFSYIRHQIHHQADNISTLGLISKEDYNEAYLNDKNYYTEEELRKSIEEMCKIIAE